MNDSDLNSSLIPFHSNLDIAKLIHQLSTILGSFCCSVSQTGIMPVHACPTLLPEVNNPG